MLIKLNKRGVRAHMASGGAVSRPRADWQSRTGRIVKYSRDRSHAYVIWNGRYSSERVPVDLIEVKEICPRGGQRNAETHDVQSVRGSDQREFVLLSALRSQIPAHVLSDLPQARLDDARAAGVRVRLRSDCLLTAQDKSGATTPWQARRHFRQPV